MPYVGTLGIAREHPGQAMELFLSSGASGDPAGALVDAFAYLKEQPYVRGGRTGFMGFSAGASLAALAAADTRIRDEVAFLHWFGGYYNAEDTVLALLTGEVGAGEDTRSWEPVAWATERVRRALIDSIAQDLDEAEALEELLSGLSDSRSPPSERLLALSPGALEGYLLASTTSSQTARTILEGLPGGLVATLRRLSPETYAQDIHAPTFVLHDVGDTFIPPVESERFWSALPPERRAAYAQVSLFDHVTIQGPRDWGGFASGMIRLIGHLTVFLLSID